MLDYESDHTLGHREYWQSVREAVQSDTPVTDYESLTLAELELLTRPTREGAL